MLDDSNVRVLLHSFAFSYSRGGFFHGFFMTKSDLLQFVPAV